MTTTEKAPRSPHIIYTENTSSHCPGVNSFAPIFHVEIAIFREPLPLPPFLPIFVPYLDGIDSAPPRTGRNHKPISSGTNREGMRRVGGGPRI